MNPRAAIIWLLTGLTFTSTTFADTPATVTTAFTPDCGKLLLEKIREARQEIKVAIFEFTKKDLTDALIDRAQHNVKVSVKIDAHEAEYQFTQDLLTRLQQAKITIERIKLPANVKMHNKFAVIDSKCVVTGSYNWTKRATEENWENLIAIESVDVAKSYLAEWQRIKSTP